MRRWHTSYIRRNEHTQCWQCEEFAKWPRPLLKSRHLKICIKSILSAARYVLKYMLLARYLLGLSYRILIRFIVPPYGRIRDRSSTLANLVRSLWRKVYETQTSARLQQNFNVPFRSHNAWFSHEKPLKTTNLRPTTPWYANQAKCSSNRHIQSFLYILLWLIS